MNRDDFFARLEGFPAHAIAVAGNCASPGSEELSYAALVDRVEALAGQFLREDVRVLATRLDNSARWIVADLAALRANVVHVPIPLFFTDRQQRHVMNAAGVDAVLGPPAGAVGAAWAAGPAGLQRLAPRQVRIPAGTAKVTFTSGTTGAPKGVCLDAANLLAVAAGIAEATAALSIERHLCALPLAILLENVAGVLAPLVRGATIVVPSLEEVGLQGSSSFDPARLDSLARRSRCQSVVLLPQMLRAWSRWLHEHGASGPPALRLVAVGGAAVGATTIAAARAVGLPAFEGYGLSEGASVQTLNLPGADRIGSVGRPLPHARVRVTADGEIQIRGSLFLGYLGAPQDSPSTPSEWWPSGDLGEIDADGFVHVRGRKDAVLVTGFGRNVSPEWVETALQAAGGIARAVVLGDGRHPLGAVIWPANCDCNGVAAAVARANSLLPDYARIHSWVRARHEFDRASGMATSNGRPRRAAIAAAYHDDIFTTMEH